MHLPLCPADQTDSVYEVRMILASTFSLVVWIFYWGAMVTAPFGFWRTADNFWALATERPPFV